MWVIRRLKALGAGEQELLKVFRAQVLSVLQFATPAWSTLLTGQESNRIESVLRTGLYLVYGERFQPFPGLSVRQRCFLGKNREEECLTNLQEILLTVRSSRIGL